ncbi:MAG: AbrB/MazE/SpoVT family DNA-binding domain-containing protein [Myxococcota bacterium]
MTVTLGAKGQVRLPVEVAKKLKLRKGARLEVVATGGGVFLIPPGRIPKDQRYFYTPEWQSKEREADEAIERGEVIGPFVDPDQAIRALRTAKV